MTDLTFPDKTVQSVRPSENLITASPAMLDVYSEFFQATSPLAERFSDVKNNLTALNELLNDYGASFMLYLRHRKEIIEQGKDSKDRIMQADFEMQGHLQSLHNDLLFGTNILLTSKNILSAMPNIGCRVGVLDEQGGDLKIIEGNSLDSMLLDLLPLLKGKNLKRVIIRSNRLTESGRAYEVGFGDMVCPDKATIRYGVQGIVKHETIVNGHSEYDYSVEKNFGIPGLKHSEGMYVNIPLFRRRS